MSLVFLVVTRHHVGTHPRAEIAGIRVAMMMMPWRSFVTRARGYENDAEGQEE